MGKKHRLLYILALFMPVATHGLNYTFGADYSFVHSKESIRIETFYSPIAKAEMDKDGFSRNDLCYAEGGAACFVNAHLSRDHTLSFQLGYGQMKLRFEGNPFFNQERFNDGIISVGYITTAMKQWRWVLTGGIHANLDHFNLGNNAFYTAVVWGRLACKKSLGIHVGALGQSGVKSTYLFPLLGVDYFFKGWQVNAIFPLDFSLSYCFEKGWSTALSYRGFGGWYRSFHRVGANEPLPEGMVSVHSSGLDIGIYLKRPLCSFALFAGSNFGGWILIRNQYGANPTYFNFSQAFYGGGELNFQF